MFQPAKAGSLRLFLYDELKYRTTAGVKAGRPTKTEPPKALFYIFVT